MLSPNYRPRCLRATSTMVAVVQLLLVTWVPVVHPAIHPDRALATPVSAVDVLSSGAEGLVLGATVCVACMISAKALPSPHRLRQGAELSGKQASARQQNKRQPLQFFSPTNPARAPPPQ
jgi:hypothetical protein